MGHILASFGVELVGFYGGFKTVFLVILGVQKFVKMSPIKPFKGALKGLLNLLKGPKWAPKTPPDNKSKKNIHDTTHPASGPSNVNVVYQKALGEVLSCPLKGLISPLKAL